MGAGQESVDEESSENLTLLDLVSGSDVGWQGDLAAGCDDSCLVTVMRTIGMEF